MEQFNRPLYNKGVKLTFKKLQSLTQNTICIKGKRRGYYFGIFIIYYLLVINKIHN